MPLTTYNFIKNYCFLMAILLGFSGFYILNGGNCNYQISNLTHLENNHIPQECDYVYLNECLEYADVYNPKINSIVRCLVPIKYINACFGL